MTLQTPPTGISIALAARQLRLCIASTFMVVHWPIRTNGAVSALATLRGLDMEQLLSSLYDRWRSEIEPDVRGKPWSADVAKQVGNRDVLVGLSEADALALITSLEICHLEFSDRGGWIDFTVAAPGAIADFGLQPDDRRRTADYLRRAMKLGLGPAL